MRQKSKRTVNKVGRGSFTKVRLVTSKRLNPYIVKRLAVKITENQKNRIRAAITENEKALTMAGIPFLKTRFLFEKQSNDRYLLAMLQEPIPKSSFLSEYLKYCSKAEALGQFENICKILNAAEEYNSKHPTKLILDLYLPNLAAIDGKTVIVDRFPPFLKGPDALPAEYYALTLNKPLYRFLGRLSPALTRRQVNKKINNMEPKALMSRIPRRFTAIRPELEQEIKKIGYEYFISKAGAKARLSPLREPSS